MGESTLPQGGATYVVGQFSNMPQDPNDDTKFHPDLEFRLDMQRSSEGTWIEENGCDPSLFGRNYTFDTWWRSEITVWSGSLNNFVVESDCPVGAYRILTTAKNRSTNTVLITTTKSVTIIHGPQVEIELSSEPYYRGNEIDVTMEFTYLNNLQDGSNLTYRADVMKIHSENSLNFANDCEGTALGNSSKSGETNDNNFNPSYNPSGTIDDQDGDGTVEISGQIPATCPTGRYRLTVELRDSSKRELTSATKEFVVSTDPSATPSVRVSMSEDSPVTPGTEFNVTFSFFDLQDDTAIRYLDTLTNLGTNQPVGRMECGGGGVGWGQDVSSTVTRNPIVHRITITSDCPVGSYRLKSVIQDNSGNEIISGSIDFDIGDPDLTPTAPSVSNFTAKQNSPFSQQLPTGSGGDGTLSYTATPLPTGLSFNSSTRTIAGTPTGHGIAMVTYTVTDADGDPDSVQFTITVAQDFRPSPPVILNFTGRVGRYFEQQISRGTGDDLPLSFSVTDLPDGLDFFQDTHMITGTPTKQQSPTVTYTVRDGDQDEERTTFTI